MVNIEIKEINWGGLKNKAGRIMLSIGRRRSGKTILMKFLMFLLHTEYDLAIGISPTRESQQFFEQVMPRAFVFHEFNPATLQIIIKIAQSLLRRGKHRRILLCVDDCGFDRAANRSAVMRELCMNGRHYSIDLMINLQYSIDFTPDLRAQIDNVFVFKDPIRANRERLWKNFFGIFPNFEDYCKVLEACTNDYEFLALDQTSSNNKIEDCVFWGKARLNLPPFRIGRPIFWDLTKMTLREDHSDDILAQAEAATEAKNATEQKLPPPPGTRIPVTMVSSLTHGNPNNKIDCVVKTTN